MVSKIIQRLKRASGAELKRGDLPFKIESDSEPSPQIEACFAIEESM